jgi:hypothetical protein
MRTAWISPQRREHCAAGGIAILAGYEHGGIFSAAPKCKLATEQALSSGSFELVLRPRETLAAQYGSELAACTYPIPVSVVMVKSIQA